MRENQLDIDLKKHLLYSKQVKKVILNHLRNNFSQSEADSLWERIQHVYGGFLKTFPYLGGKKTLRL